MKFSRIALLSLLFGKRAESDVALLEDRPGLLHLMNAMWSRVCSAYPNGHIEDVYEDYLVVGIDSPGAVEQYLMVPYRLEGDKIVLGEDVKVSKRWVPVQETESSQTEFRALSQKTLSAEDRVKTVETMLLTATGKGSVSAAIGEVERLRTVESSSASMKTRLEALEQRSYQAERSVLLSQAKRDGKWTAALEALADRSADRARKLGEDPLDAVREVFGAASIAVYQGPVAQQPRPEQGSEGSSGLSADEERVVLEQAKATGRTPEEYRTLFLQMKGRFSR